MNLHGAAGGPPGSNPTSGQNNQNQQAELSFEDFTAMSPFLDPAALHLNPYAAAAASSTGRHLKISNISRIERKKTKKDPKCLVLMSFKSIMDRPI